MKCIFKIFFVFFILLQNLYSGTIKVPQDLAAIQAGIDSSSNGDTVLVSPGTYYENINFNGKNIILGSLFLTTGDTSYISQTVIDGSQQGCVVVFESGEDSTTVLTGFTITNGYSNQDSLRGGGITCSNSSNPKLSDLIVVANKVDGNGKAYGGGGIYCLRQSSPIMRNLYIKNNDVGFGYGGGIYCRDSSNVTMTDLIIMNNHSYRGGGIAIKYTRLNLKNMQIIRNNSREGGGIYLRNSLVEIRNSDINENVAKQSFGARGGGIFAESSNVLIKNTDINSNSAEASWQPDSEGGGVSVISSSLQIENCNINNNTSIGCGGGITTDNSNTKMYSTLISNNKAMFGDGGGIREMFANDNNSLYLENIILQSNYASRKGGGINYFPSTPTESFKNVVIKNNLAGEKGGGLSSNSNLLITAESDCSIFLNKAKVSGTDIHMLTEDSNLVSTIYLDTITVSQPNDYHIHPKQNIDLHYNYAIFQSVDSDLYVSPVGSNNNNGTSKVEPLKTISHALLVANADSNNKRTIHLSEGIYSNSTTKEEFPLFGRSYVSIKGEKADAVILDGENSTRLMDINGTNIILENYTIQNGFDFGVGGMNIHGKNILLKNLILKDNNADIRGVGGMRISNSSHVDLQNLTIVNNKSDDQMGSGGIRTLWAKKVSIINCIIKSNTPNNLMFNSWGRDTVLIGYSNIGGGKEGIDKSDSLIIQWMSNIDKDPLFIGGEPFDYHLSDSSPCINAGTPFFVWEGDKLINLSPEEYIGDAPDMGALESDVIISVEDDEILPTEFKLEQNYPNPFNPTTTISYQLPEKRMVTLKVYNMLGQEIATLINEIKASGKHSATFNAENLPSGMYIYRMQSGNFTESKKILLLK